MTFLDQGSGVARQTGPAGALDLDAGRGTGAHDVPRTARGPLCNQAVGVPTLVRKICATLSRETGVEDAAHSDNNGFPKPFSVPHIPAWFAFQA